MKNNMINQSKFKQNNKGRSMIEMLGVLGIMAVITVLAIIAYKMAYRNSKMNELKQELGTINQQIETSYSNQKFQDEGVVLGEDRTFENMFIDTKMLKSSVTPFGGTYSISAISGDLYEITMTDVEEEDCKYVIESDNILNKMEKLTMSCVDVNGVTHYSKNNTNNPEYSGGNDGNNNGNTGGENGGNTGGGSYDPYKDTSVSEFETEVFVCFATRFNHPSCDSLENSEAAEYLDEVFNNSELEESVERLKEDCDNLGNDVACSIGGLAILESGVVSPDQLLTDCQGGSKISCNGFAAILVMESGPEGLDNLNSMCEAGEVAGACKAAAIVDSIIPVLMEDSMNP